jgi:hypothetical protein
MPMPLHLENRNLLICASVGAGKSVAMESMMASTVGRRDKMVVVDPNGTFLSKFGFPGDIVLYPCHWAQAMAGRYWPDPDVASAARRVRRCPSHNSRSAARARRGCLC